MAPNDSENLLEPKTARTPNEVGREVFRLLQQHDTICITQDDNRWDVRMFLPDD